MAAEFNDDNFQAEVLDSSVPVLVDFWSEGCPPCRQIAPVIDELSTENEGAAKVGKVNVSENMDLAVKYGISGVSNDPVVQRWRCRCPSSWRGTKRSAAIDDQRERLSTIAKLYAAEVLPTLATSKRKKPANKIAGFFCKRLGILANANILCAERVATAACSFGLWVVELESTLLNALVVVYRRAFKKQ